VYKEINKSSSSWQDIARKEYGTPDKADNLKRLNNGKEDNNIIVYDSQNTNNNPTNITNKPELIINNKPITEYIQIDLINSIQDIRSAIVYTHRIDDIKVFDHCAISQNNRLFLQGYIKNITPILNANDKHYIIQIKSIVGILLDTAVPLPLEFTNSNLKDIIESVCSVYNIKTIFTNNTNNILNYKINNEIETSASAKLNESLWSFITRLCNARGLLIQDTGTNEIIIGTTDNNKSKLSAIYGQSSIANWMPIYNYDNLARYYEIYSQFNTNAKELVTLEQIKLPITKRIVNNEINEGILKNYANWIAGREIGKAVKAQIEFLNDSDTKDIDIGNYINIQNKLIGFEEPTDLIVEKIIASYPNKTTMILTLPCAYNGTMPTTLPMLC
jgi:prophage tail gpP-like protein